LALVVGRLIALGLIALALPGAAAAPAPVGATPPSQAHTVVVGLLADPVTLDAHRATDIVSGAILVNVCEPLVRLRDAGSRPEPALATTWATLDNRTWTFTLREGVRFHDGAAFDADAVLANVEDLRQRGTLRARAARLGPHAVSLTLEQPNAALLATLSQPLYCLLSPAALADTARPPVGTGPFRLASARPGLVELEALPSHWSGAPRLRRVTFRRLPDEGALVEALLSGAVDVTSALGPAAAERLHRKPRLAVDSRTGLNLCFVSINNERAPFTDRRVRLALAHALDRETLVRRVLAGHGEPARAPLPPLLAGASRPGGAAARDPGQARKLLAQAGLAQGFDTTLLFSAVPRPYLPAPHALAEQLRGELADVGVRVKLVEVPSWSEHTERAQRGAYDLALLGWQADTLDPNDFLSALLSSEAIGATNRSRYRSEAMDGLLRRGRRLADPAQRQAAYREAQALFQRDAPWIPLYHVAVLAVYRRDVQGLMPGPTGILRFDKVWKAR
jgi:ABC-type transport system substrate-binding protein